MEDLPSRPGYVPCVTTLTGAAKPPADWIVVRWLDPEGARRRRVIALVPQETELRRVADVLPDDIGSHLRKLATCLPAAGQIDRLATFLPEETVAKIRAAAASLPPGLAEAGDGGNLEQLYKATRNPIYAWQAYRACRRHAASLPAWVLTYLDGAALGLELCTSRAAERGFETAPAVADALGFAAGRGPKNVFTHLLDAQEMEIGREVHELRQDINKKKEAIRSVSERHGLPESTVRDYYERWLRKKRAIGGTEAEPAGKVVPLKKSD